MSQRQKKSQDDIISGFYASFKEKFFHDASPTGVSSVIEKVINDKENQHVHDFFVGRSYEHLVEMLKINNDKVKQEQTAHLNELIEGLKLGQAESFANQMHTNGLLSNDEYLKVFNEQIEPKRVECREIMEKQKLEQEKKLAEVTPGDLPKVEEVQEEKPKKKKKTK